MDCGQQASMVNSMALWPQADTWGGRAKFADNRTLIIDCPHWEALKTGYAAERIYGSSKMDWRDAPEELLPSIPQSVASFDGVDGIDPFGRKFNYIDGRLDRGCPV